MDNRNLKQVQPNVQVRDIELELENPSVITSKTKRAELEPYPSAELSNISQGQDHQDLEETQKKKIKLTIPRLPHEADSTKPEETVIQTVSQGTDIIIPSYSAWFSFTEISDIEKKSLPEFFNGKCASKSSAVYKDARDFMIHSYRLRPTEYLTVTACRRHLSGDVSSIMRIHAFLERWGLINYQVDMENKPSIAVPANTENFRILADTPKGLQPFYPHIPASSTRSVVNSEEGIKIDLNLTTRENVFKGDNLIRSLNSENSDVPVKPSCSTCKVECGKVFFHCTKDAKVNICKSCYNEGRFSSSLCSGDFVKFDGNDMAEIQWTDQETLLLLEGLEMYTDDWDRIAEHVGTKSQEQCVLQFLQLPIIDPLLEKEFVKRATDPSLKNPLEMPRIPFSHSENPVMATVGFLASMVHPNIASAAAKAALEALGQLEEQNAEVNGDFEKTCATAIGAAASKAQSLAKMEEAKVSRLINVICEAQMKKIELKLNQFEEIEKSLEDERKEIERQKLQIITDRMNLKRTVLAIAEKFKDEVDAVQILGSDKISIKTESIEPSNHLQFSTNLTAL